MDVSSWRWVFAINVVPIAATLAVIARLPREPSHAEQSRVDWPGGVLCAVGLGGIIYALIEAPAHGWSRPAITLPLAAGAGAFVAFLIYERAVGLWQSCGFEVVGRVPETFWHPQLGLVDTLVMYRSL